MTTHSCNAAQLDGELFQKEDSITEANSAILTKHASIPTTGVAGEGVWCTLVKDKNNPHTRLAMRIDFDLAVTVTQNDNLKVGGGISIASLVNAGTTCENSSQSESVSRIRYTIPLELPELNNNTPTISTSSRGGVK